MSRMPLTFDPPDWEDHLEFTTSEGIVRARWAPYGLSICYPELAESQTAPSRQAVLSKSPQLHFHGHYGYSIGRFTEIFVFVAGEGFVSEDDYPNPVAFTMGAVEGEFGQATPLAHLLYQNDHDEDYQGPFSSLFSLRLHEITRESAEVVTLSALLLLGREHDLRLQPVVVGGYWDEDEDDDDDQDDDDYDEHDDGRREGVANPALILPAGFIDADVLRMLFRGRDERTAVVAFHQLYRVLEYFSVFHQEDKIAALRANVALSTRQFIVQLQELAARDEKAALGRLLGTIADGAVLAVARTAKLIADPSAQALTNALYEFRNSVVHAKEDRGARLFTESIFLEESTALAWKNVCEALAWRAIERYGSRLR